MKTIYLILAFIAFIATFILSNMNSQIAWATLSFAIVMLLFGLFSKVKEEVVNNLNKPKEGNKNGI